MPIFPVLLLLVAALALAPFLFPGAKALNVAAKICIYTNDHLTIEELGAQPGL